MALASADVSHLSNKYLPPSQSTVETSYTAPISVVQQGYSSPVIRQTYAAPAPLQTVALNQQYTASAVTPITEYVPIVQQTLPQAPAFQQTFATPAVPVVQQTYAPSVSYSAPAVSYSAPIVKQLYAAPTVSYSVPAVQASYPATSVQTSYSAPVVQTSYSAPAIQQFYAAPSVSIASGNIGTQYAADGGYIYKKK